MLISLREEEFDSLVDFAYELALRPAQCSYPAYFDGVKTKADFIAHARKAFSLPGEEILLYQVDGSVEGWMHYYYLDGERYIAMRSCCIRRNAAEALEELSCYLAARHPGCDWDMGFPAENREALAWLAGAGFEKLEESNHYQFFFDQYVPRAEELDAERINKENFDKFQKIHRTIESDMYWNSQRVLKNISRWDLFVAEKDGVSGEIMGLDEGDGWYEIFALACEDGQYHENVFRRLLCCALNEGKKRGAKYLAFFVDVPDQVNNILPELGFQRIGRYLAYRKKIECA